ncbi:MAG: cation:proton antiporter [Magnetococcales bacterium]|nr:cation:proton antiporter [Magnetococcales bacterium]
MHDRILIDLLVIFSLSVVVVYLCHHIRVAPIVGFLFTGALAGPFGFSLISSITEVELLAEIGVMLLLFTIGLELSLEKLVEMKRAVFIGGGMQVGLTIAAGSSLALVLGFPINQAIFLGFLLALSSTAIVLKVLQQRGEIGSAHGKTAVGILIFQDLIVVPMLLLVPILAGRTEDPLMELVHFVGKFLLIGLLLWFVSHRLLPSLLFRVAKLRDQELFFLTIIVVGLGVAWLTSMAGLSLALGAFLAGLIISRSEYGHQAFASIQPFRDIFISLFFVSIGMLMNVSFFAANLLPVLGVTLGLVLLAAILASVSAYASGLGFASAVAVGISLAQIGEFSFLLARSGVSEGMLSTDLYQFFLAVSIVTMAATPVLIAHAKWIGRKLAHIPGFRRLAVGRETGSAQRKAMRDHLIIVGYGENGRDMAQLARRQGIHSLILETNPETVRGELAAGALIFFGDATQETVLRHAGIQHARALLVTVPQISTALRIVENAHNQHPDLTIIVRTSFLSEMAVLKEKGADHVVAMHQEVSDAICRETLQAMGISEEKIGADLKWLRLNHGNQDV